MNQPWMYICSPSWMPLPFPSPSQPSGSSQCTSPEHPVSYIKPGLEIYFTYGNIHVSVPFSQIIPLSTSPTERKGLFFTSVSLSLFFLIFHFIIYYYFFNYFTILYWFYHTLTWICHRCTRVPHSEPPLPPPSPYHPSGSSQCTRPEHPVSCIESGLVIHFTYDITHVSMPFSQIIPPLPSRTESKRLFYTSVSLFLSHTQGYCYHLSKFHIYTLIYCIGVFLSGLLHSV